MTWGDRQTSGNPFPLGPVADNPNVGMLCDIGFDFPRVFFFSLRNDGLGGDPGDVIFTVRYGTGRGQDTIEFVNPGPGLNVPILPAKDVQVTWGYRNVVTTTRDRIIVASMAIAPLMWLGPEGGVNINRQLLDPRVNPSNKYNG